MPRYVCLVETCRHIFDAPFANYCIECGGAWLHQVYTDPTPQELEAREAAIFKMMREDVVRGASKAPAATPVAMLAPSSPVSPMGSPYPAPSSPFAVAPAAYASPGGASSSSYAAMPPSASGSTFGGGGMMPMGHPGSPPMASPSTHAAPSVRPPSPEVPRVDERAVVALAARVGQALECLEAAAEFAPDIPHGIPGDKAIACCDGKYYLSGHGARFAGGTKKRGFMDNFEEVDVSQVRELGARVGLTEGSKDDFVHAEKKAAADGREFGQPIGVTRPVCDPSTKYSPDCQTFFCRIARAQGVYEILADSTEYLGKTKAYNRSYRRIWIFCPSGNIYQLRQGMFEDQLGASGICRVPFDDSGELQKAIRAILLRES